MAPFRRATPVTPFLPVTACPRAYFRRNHREQLFDNYPWTVASSSLMPTLSLIHLVTTSSQERYSLKICTPSSVLLANGCLAQDLCLGLVGQDCSIVATVQSGDSCSSIATAANIDPSVLHANNPNVNANCTNIYPGEVRSIQTVRVHILILLQVLCTDGNIINYS